MRDYFFQIVLFLAGIVAGVVIPLLPNKGQKWVAGVLSVLLIMVALIWVGYELGVREISSPVIVGTTLDTPTHTPTSNSSADQPIPPSDTPTATPTPTNTSPTDTPIPPTDTPGTSTPIPAIGIGSRAIILEDRVILLAEPTLSSRAVGAVFQDSEVVVLDVIEDREWVLIRSPGGREGWVKVETLQLLNTSSD